MKFHNLLDELVASKVKTKVLRLLIQFPAKKFSGREIARLTNLSPSRTIQILNFFQKYSLVNRLKVGNAVEWSLNRENFIIDEVSRFIKIEERAARKLKQVILSYLKANPDILEITMYGSVVKKEERPDSDVDIFILTKDKNSKAKVSRDIHNLNLKTLSLFGNRVSELIYSEQELKKKRESPIIKNICSEGITLLKRTPHGYKN